MPGENFFKRSYQMAQRNPYVITSALNSYLKGSVIIAISGYLVTATDALIVSWLIGTKAFTAVNLVIPLLTFFSSLMVLLGTGASISISKALGRRERQTVNLSFSSTFVAAIAIGIVAAVITYRFTDEIVRYLVHKDPVIEEYAAAYLKNFCYAVPFLIVAGVTGYIIRTDGNTKLVSGAVWTGIVSNVILDIVFIRYMNMGIAGAAWATAINYFLKFIICLFHFVSHDNTIGFSVQFKKYLRQLADNCRLGFSTSLNTLLPAVTLFVINSLMMKYQGAEGIYCWAVCYQVFLILQMILSGIDTSIFALGGVLMGEDDVTGLNFIYRRCFLYLTLAVIALSVLIIIFPEFFGHFFGNKGEDRLDLLPLILKIFSFFLLPYALIMQVRSIYTILERGILSLFICISPFVLMILLIWISCVYNPAVLWWSFAISAWTLFVFLLIYTAIIHFRHKNLRIFSLIPKIVAGPVYNISVALNEADKSETVSEIKNFLTQHDISSSRMGYVATIMDKVIDSIIKDLQNSRKNKYFDINVRIKDNEIIIILKDAGNRLDEERGREVIADLNKVQVPQDDDASNRSCRQVFTTNYFYMNNQNTITINFDCQ